MMNAKYTIRKATDTDIELIMKMMDHSRSVMRADGNVSQWVGYPTDDDVADDIRQGVSYVVGSGGNAAQGVGTFALVPGAEPTYAHIDHGRWIDHLSPYSTLHRLAALPDTSGIAHVAFSYAKAHCPYLRVDTHATNRPMRHILEREGFVRSGIIYMPDGGPRDAYEWWRFDQVPTSLQEYVETAILPRYDHFDPAHRRDHARRVIARAMVCLSGCFSTTQTFKHSNNQALIYAAAAMHDLGLAEGREEHHLASGRIIRADHNLRRWFSEADIETIAQAAEDHRASATTPPRSALGCIIAEADRDIEPDTIVRRTVQYGLGHYPSLDREGHWQRTLDHLHEKYAEGGYIKLWLSPSPNDAPLAELRELIHDEPRLRSLFDQLINSEF